MAPIKFQDLGNLWVKQGLAKAKNELAVVTRSYASLKDKDSHYAKAQQRIINIRTIILDIWKENADEQSNDKKDSGDER